MMTKPTHFPVGEKLRQMHGTASVVKYSGYIKIALAFAFVFLVYKFLSMRSLYKAMELEISTARRLVNSLDSRGRAAEMKTQSLQEEMNQLLKEIDECKLSVGDKEIESKKATDEARMCFDLMEQHKMNCTGQIENQKAELGRNSDTLSRLERTVQEQEVNLNSKALLLADCMKKTVLELPVITRRTETNEALEQANTLNLERHELPAANDIEPEKMELETEDDEYLNKYKETLYAATASPVDLLVNGQEFGIDGEEQEPLLRAT